MQDACTYVLIPEITILGHSDHKTSIMIEFATEIGCNMHVICPIPEITILGYSNPKQVSELTREYPEHNTNTQICMSSMDILRVQLLSLCELNGHLPPQISILNYGKLIGHPPEFNIQLR